MGRPTVAGRPTPCFAELGVFALAFAWPAEAEVSARGCAIQSDVHFAFMLYCCYHVHIHASAEKQAAPQRASVQDKSAREVAPLRSLVCNACAMQKCSPVVNSRWKVSVYRKSIPILAVKRVCTGKPFQMFV